MHPSLPKLYYTRSPHPSPLGLASQLGWFLQEFREDGIQVFTLQETDDPQLRSSHLNHHLTNSIRQGGNVPALWARATGADTRVIGLNWIDEFQGILSRRGSGITGVADLRGRRFGLPVYSSVIESKRAEALHGFIVALELAGLSLSDAELVDIEAASPDLHRPAAGQPASLYGEYSRQIGALLRGDVDAVYVKGARGLQAAHSAGAHVVLDIRSHPDPLVRVHTGAPRPITVDQTLLDTHPAIVARFLARVVSIGGWAASHPAETLAYVSRETKAREEWVQLAYGPNLHRLQHTDLAQSSIDALEAHKKFLLKWGFIPHDFSIADWIDPKPLAAVWSGARSEPRAAVHA